MAMRSERMGCLLIGEAAGGRLGALRERLRAAGVATQRVAPGGADFLEAAQAALYETRGARGACVAAEGACWPVALALAAQLSVDRVALFEPEAEGAPESRGALGRIEAYARRNLFFCVADVLVLEGAGGARSLERVWRGLCNARVERVSLRDQKWTNCKQSPIEAAARFLEAGVSPFALAKSRKTCIIEA